MTRYWVGIISSPQGVVNFEARLWWCMPSIANLGDQLLMYCPRSSSPRHQGVFALCEVKEPPKDDNKNNFLCSGFGERSSKTKLRYTGLELIRKYNNHLIASEIKNDPILKNIQIVRKNFQGTTFEIDAIHFHLIQKMVEEKNKETR